MSPVDEVTPTDPRVRAARTKRDRTRRALLDAADATFGSRGWARTRIEDIAAAAGVSAATAYNHFPSKHSLVGHVYAPLVHSLLVQAERDIAAGRSAVVALEDQLRALTRTAARHRELTASFFCAVQDYTIRVEGPADQSDEIDPRTLVPMPEPLRLLVAYGQARGELREYPPAVEISTMIINLLLIRTLTVPDESADARAELLLTLLFGALRPELLLDRPAAEGHPFSRHP